MITDRKKLGIGETHRQQQDEHRRERHRGTSQQRRLLQLGDQAVVILALRVRVKELMKLGRRRQDRSAQPQ